MQQQEEFLPRLPAQITHRGYQVRLELLMLHLLLHKCTPHPHPAAPQQVLVELLQKKNRANDSGSAGNCHP